MCDTFTTNAGIMQAEPEGPVGVCRVAACVFNDAEA